MTSEAFVLDPTSALPSVPRHPSPWRLQGNAYAVLAKLPPNASEDAWFVAPSLRGKRSTDLVLLLYVDYQSSNCGPYRELMAVPAGFDFGDKRMPSITRIYVSTFDSVVNGRINWGIPKDRADFSVEPGARGDLITVSRDGRAFANMQLQGRGPALPATAGMLPAAWRTIAQHWHGQEYRIVLAARGKARLARVIDWSFDRELFPDFTQAKVIAAAQLPTFEMTFPVADVKPIG